MLQDRPAGGVTDQKVPFAQKHAPIDNLEDVIKQIKPTAIIGKQVASCVNLILGVLETEKCLVPLNEHTRTQLGYKIKSNSNMSNTFIRNSTSSFNWNRSVCYFMGTGKRFH